MDILTEPWIADIDPDMLPEPYRRLAELMGLEPVLKLAKEYQGMSQYFPKLDGTLNMIRNKKIVEEYQARHNVKDLARKYCLTETWIRNILGDSSIDTDQLSLFDNAV